MTNLNGKTNSLEIYPCQIFMNLKEGLKEIPVELDINDTFLKAIYEKNILIVNYNVEDRHIKFKLGENPEAHSNTVQILDMLQIVTTYSSLELESKSYIFLKSSLGGYGWRELSEAVQNIIPEWVIDSKVLADFWVNKLIAAQSNSR